MGAVVAFIQSRRCRMGAVVDCFLSCCHNVFVYWAWLILGMLSWLLLHVNNIYYSLGVIIALPTSLLR